MQTNRSIAGSKQSSLAINGGNPVRKEWLPYGHQSIDQSDIDAVVAALKSEFLTQGPRVALFEKAVADFVGVKYAVAVSNGTAALHAAYESLGIGIGDFIITSPITFAATSNAAIYLGARPLFADIEADTGLISVESVKELLDGPQRDRVKAIAAIDFGGQPCDYDALESLAKSRGIPLVIDAAHSLGASYKSRNGGFAGEISTMSFHPVKSITTGEGGIILTNREDLYQKLLAVRSHGIIKAADKLTRADGPWYHEMQTLGYNYRLCDIQAALGTSQMQKLPQFLARRKAIAALYRKKLADNPAITCATIHGDRTSAYHLFPILVQGKPHSSTRRAIFEALHGENIGVQVHYIPTYQMPYYQNHVVDRDWSKLCPNAESFYNREIGLPIFAGMTDEDVDDVVTALDKIASHLY